jgi:energy-coupling factor transporter ATP-binding protein EcfA2
VSKGNAVVKLRASDEDSRWAEGFTKENDVFQRRDLADRLTNLYCNLEQGTVAILDGGWGTGKSTFVKMWLQMLNERQVPAVYLDAFSQDYVSDPFEALCSAFVTAAVDAEKTDSQEFKDFAKKMTGVGRRLLPTLAKISLKAATVGLVGSSEIEAVQSAIDSGSDAAADAVEERLRELLTNHAKTANTFNALRGSIASLVTQIDREQDASQSSKLIIVVDELDRCRPSFAVAMLEIIKHFFRADGVHFVIVTKTSSLASSFAAVHNLGSGGTEYLEKFYDFIIHIPLYINEYSELNIKDYISQSFREVVHLGNQTTFSNSLEEMGSILAIAHRMNLRQINAFVMSSALCRSALSKEDETSGFIVSHLIMLKIMRPDLYSKLKIGELSWEEIQTVIPPRHQGYDADHISNVFGYYLISNLADLPEDYRKLNDRLNMRLRREQILPYIANTVVDMFAQPTR